MMMINQLKKSMIILIVKLASLVVVVSIFVFYVYVRLDNSKEISHVNFISPKTWMIKEIFIIILYGVIVIIALTKFLLFFGDIKLFSFFMKIKFASFIFLIIIVGFLFRFFIHLSIDLLLE